MNATIRMFVALVLMVALGASLVSMPLLSGKPTQAAQPIAAVVPTIQTAVWVKLHLRWLARRHPHLLARMLWGADRIANELFGVLIIGMLLVACTSFSGPLMLAAVIPSLRRPVYYDQLTPAEKADWTRRSNKIAKGVADSLQAAAAKLQAENAKAADVVKALNAKATAAALVSAQNKAVSIASVPDGNAFPVPFCKAYISEYVIKDAKGDVTGNGTEIVETSKVDNINRDGIKINGLVHHFGKSGKAAGALRDLLESRMDEEYIVLSVEDFNNALLYIREGYLLNKELWHTALGVVRDGGTVLILTRAKHDMVKFLEGLGLSIRITSMQAGNSAAKYLKRALSHHEAWWEGKAIKSEEVEIVNVTYRKGELVEEKIKGMVYHVRFDGVDRIFKIFVRPDDPATDGCSHISVKMLKDLGYFTPWGAAAKAGYLAAITALTGIGEIKGHVLAVNRQMQSCSQYDAVLIGNKKMLVTNDDRFAFAILQSKEGHGEVFTDLQSVIHFMLEKFLHGWAIEDFSHLAQWVIEGKARMPETTTVGKVMAFGAKIPGFNAGMLPKLVMKFWDLKEQRIMDAGDIRIRIPNAFSRYAIADPRIIKADGSTDVRLAGLNGDQVYCAGLTQRIAGHRQPNGHCQEHFTATAVEDAGLGWLKESGVIVFAPLHGIKMLGRMGGGDQDDNLVIYLTPEIVAHFEALPQYPGSYTPAPKHKAEPKDTPYNHNLLCYLCDVKSEQKGIGFYVNKLMVFNYFWSLTLRGMDAFKKIFATLVSLFPLGWGLEEIVDSCVKTGASLAHWDDLMDAFVESVTCVPRFLASRMKKQVDAGECEIIDTPMDTVLANIRKDSAIYKRATRRYASKIVSTKWNDWTLARQVAYVVTTMVTPAARQLGDDALEHFNTTFAKTQEAMWAEALRNSNAPSKKALQSLLVADEWEKLNARIISLAFQAAEEAFVNTLSGNKWANSAMAYLFLTLHLRVSENGLPPTSCLFGFNSCELTMAMLAKAATITVPEDFHYEWKPEFRAVRVLREGMLKLKETDPMAFLEWKGAAGKTVTLTPEVLAATNGYGEKLGGYRVDPFTNKPFVTKATVNLDGEYYGAVCDAHLDRLLLFVNGKAPQGMLVDPNTNHASMELWVGSMPAAKVRRTAKELVPQLPPQDAFASQMEDHEALNITEEDMYNLLQQCPPDLQ